MTGCVTSGGRLWQAVAAFGMRWGGGDRLWQQMENDVEAVAINVRFWQALWQAERRLRMLVVSGGRRWQAVASVGWLWQAVTAGGRLW